MRKIILPIFDHTFFTMNKRQVNITQIAFDKESAQLINPKCNLLVNPNSDRYFENSVIKMGVHLSKDGLSGCLSYRYEQKNQIEINFDQLSKTTSDIVVMPKCWTLTDPIEEGINYHGPSFKDGINFILDEIEKKFDLEFKTRKFRYSIHQNAVLATKKVWDLYLPWLNTAINLMDNHPLLDSLSRDSKYKGSLSKEKLIQICGKPYYTLHTFVLERLWSAFIDHYKDQFNVSFLKEEEVFRYPKVLIAAPQHSSKMYAWDEYWSRVKELTYPNYEVFLADNSETEDNTNYFKSLGIHAQWIKPLKEGLIATMSKSHQACADFAIANGFDYVLHLETDIIPPRDVIEQLLSWKRDVIGGVYDLFYGSKRKAMIQQVESYDRSIRAFTSAQFVEESEPLYFDGDIHRVFHIGLGCVLIHQSILRDIKFRYVKGVNAHPDTWFANDCFQQRIPIYIDTNIHCKHRNQTWLSNIDEINKNVSLKN